MAELIAAVTNPCSAKRTSPVNVDPHQSGALCSPEPRARSALDLSRTRLQPHVRSAVHDPGTPDIDTSPQEVRPRWDCDFRSHTLRQQPPKFRMMPAEIMTAAVAVLSDSSPQPLDLIDQLFAGHPVHQSL